MPDVALSLKIKYGLVSEPLPDKIAEWARRTEAHLASGLSSEEAGSRAARDTFLDYGRMSYKAEADTVLALLDEAKRRPGPSGR